jgi:hypothetical protein
MYFIFQPDPAPPEWNHDVAQSISAGLDPEVGCVIVSFDHHLVSILPCQLFDDECVIKLDRFEKYFYEFLRYKMV